MKSYISLFFAIISTLVFGQLTVTTGIPPADLVQNTLIGTGVTATNITYTGSPQALGRFQTGTNPTNLGISSGIIMSTGHVNGSPQIGSPVGGFASTNLGFPGDATLNALGLGTTQDATVLEFDFVPLSDTVRFRYVFSSEEYPEFVNTSFNDVFGFFVSGLNPMGGNYVNRNIALIPGTATPVSINNVNHLTNSTYFVHNQNLGGATIVYDGFTVVLTAWLNVIPCTQYHIKLAIADIADGIYDSAVFLEANSFSAPEVSGTVDFSVPGAGSVMIEGCNSANIKFCIAYPLAYNYNIPVQVTGTATRNIDYTTTGINFSTNPPHIQMPAGDTCINIMFTPLIDNIPEGIETVILRYRTHQCSPLQEIILEIHDYEPLTITHSNDTVICSGSDLPISVNPVGWPPYDYVWNQGLGNDSLHIVQPTTFTNYTISVTDACGYSASGSFDVDVEDPNMDAGIDVSICEGDSVTLNASGWNSFVWSTGDTTSSITVSPLATTTYNVIANSLCLSEDSVTVFVYPNPTITISGDNFVCQGTTVSIQANGADNYLWTSNPTDGSVIPQQTLSSIIISPYVTTTYTVNASTVNGCTGSAESTVTVYPSPEADFEADRYTASSFDPIINFTDLSTGNPDFWDWFFGDGQTSIDQNPIHDYGDTGGKFNVKLVVTTDMGCSDSITKPITIQPDHVIYVPNAFNPGSAGQNSLIGIESTGVSENNFEWLIFDRWGKIIFRTLNINQKWDGRIGGGYAPSGTYNYKITYNDKFGLTHVKTGYITIIR